MPTFSALEDQYTELISTMEILPSWQSRIDHAARSIIASKDRYTRVAKAFEAKYGARVPWQFVGVVHHLEGSGDFGTHLHNGDSLEARTVNVPRGRPVDGEPPFTWEESALDALSQRSFKNIVDWSLPRVAYELEGYNGFGYRNNHTGVNSPYLWSGTNHYTKGKYIRDGVFSPSAVSEQCGAMAILNRVTALDISTVQIVDGSRKLTMVSRIKTAFTATFGGYLGADQLNIIPDYVKHFQALGLPKEVWALLGVGVVSWVVLSIIEYMHVQDYKAGNYTPSKQPENAQNSDMKL